MALAVISVCQRPAPRLNTLEFNAWSKEATLKIKTHAGREKKNVSTGFMWWSVVL